LKKERRREEAWLDCSLVLCPSLNVMDGAERSPSKERSGRKTNQHGGKNYRQQERSHWHRKEPREQSERQKRREALNKAANSGQMKHTEALLREMVDDGDFPTTITMNILIKAYARGGMPDKGMAILNAMMQGAPDAYGVYPNESTFNAVVSGYAEAGRLREAWEILQVQWAHNHDIQNSFRTILRCTQPELVLETLKQNVNSQKVILDVQMLNTALVAVLERSVEPLISEAERTLAFCRLVGVFLDNKGCMTMLNAFKRAKKLRDGVVFFQKFCEEGSIPDLRLITLALNMMVLIEPPLMEQAEALMEKAMTAYRIQPDIVVYNNLITGYGRERPPQLEKARKYFHQIIVKKGLTPTEYTFSAMANVLCSAGEIAEAEGLIFSEMEKFSLKPAAIHFNILMKGYSKCRCKLVNGYCKCTICECSDPDRALQLMSMMEKQGLKCDIVTLQCIVESLCSAAQIEKAMSIVRNVMKNLKNPESLRPTLHVYNMILRGICIKHYVPPLDRSGAWNHGHGLAHCGGIRTEDSVDVVGKAQALDEMNQVLRELEESGLVPDEVTTNTVIGIYCAFGMMRDAEQLVKNKTSNRTHSSSVRFNILLNGYSNPAWEEGNEISEEELCRKLDEIVRVEMPSVGTKPDLITLNTIVKLLCERSFPRKAVDFVHSLASEGIDPNLTTFSTILHAFDKLGLEEEREQVMFLAENHFKIVMTASLRRDVKSA